MTEDSDLEEWLEFFEGPTQMLVGAIGLSGNLLILLAFVRYPKLRSMDLLWLMAILAACDFLTG